MRLYHSASDNIHNRPRPARGAATWNCGGSCFVLGRSLGRNRDHSLDHGLGRGILLCKSGAACRRRTWWRREMRKTGGETRKRKETEKKVGRLDGLNWTWLGWDKMGAKDDVEPRCARRHPKQGSLSFALLGDPSLWTLPGGPLADRRRRLRASSSTAPAPCSGSALSPATAYPTSMEE